MPDRHAAARQRQHEHVWAIGIGCEPFSEQPASVAAIAKEPLLTGRPLHVSSSVVSPPPRSFSMPFAARTIRTIASAIARASGNPAQFTRKRTLPLKAIHDLDGHQC
jgi:hypothetical protein